MVFFTKFQYFPSGASLRSLVELWMQQQHFVAQILASLAPIFSSGSLEEKSGIANQDCVTMELDPHLPLSKSTQKFNRSLLIFQ